MFLPPSRGLCNLPDVNVFNPYWGASAGLACWQLLHSRSGILTDFGVSVFLVQLRLCSAARVILEVQLVHVYHSRLQSSECMMLMLM